MVVRELIKAQTLPLSGTLASAIDSRQLPLSVDPWCRDLIHLSRRVGVQVGMLEGEGGGGKSAEYIG